MEIPEPAADGVIYVFTFQAACLLGVDPSTITRWRHLGYLAPIPASPPRRPVYRWDDAVAAEFKARMAAIAASGTDVQVQRNLAA